MRPSISATQRSRAQALSFRVPAASRAGSSRASVRPGACNSTNAAVPRVAKPGTLAVQGQTAGWPRSFPGPRGPQCLGVSARPSSGLSHGAAGVPTRTCSAERGPDAAGPGAQRRAVGLWGAQRRHCTRRQAPARAPLPAGTLQAGSPDPPPGRVPDSSRTAAAPEPCVPARPRAALPPWRLSGRSGGSSSCSSTPRSGERLPGPAAGGGEGGSGGRGRGPARGRERVAGGGRRARPRCGGPAQRPRPGACWAPGRSPGAGSGSGPGPTASGAQAELRGSRLLRPGLPGRGRAGPGVDSLADVRPRA